MTNYERITATPEALGAFLEPCPLQVGRGTWNFTGRSARIARRRTVTGETARTMRSGITRCGG